MVNSDDISPTVANLSTLLRRGFSPYPSHLFLCPGKNGRKETFHLWVAKLWCWEHGFELRISILLQHRTSEGLLSHEAGVSRYMYKRSPHFANLQVNWNSCVEHGRVVFTYLSVDGEEGYPGDLLTTVTYEIVNENRLKVTFSSVCSETTVVNLTNHSYFNLAGQVSVTCVRSEGVCLHNFMFRCNRT